MVLLERPKDQSLSSVFFWVRRQYGACLYGAGPKGAPPTIPPIIINPHAEQAPQPAIDPIHTPLRPPVMPPPRPAISCQCA